MTDLDRWAAQFMGWVWSDEHEMWVVDSERDADGRLTFASPDALILHDESVDQMPWHPSSDLNQCFMVVEKMWILGWDFQLKSQKREDWMAVFEKDNWGATIYDTDYHIAILEAAREAISESPESHLNEKA